MKKAAKYQALYVGSADGEGVQIGLDATEQDYLSDPDFMHKVHEDQEHLKYGIIFIENELANAMRQLRNRTWCALKDLQGDTQESKFYSLIYEILPDVATVAAQCSTMMQDVLNAHYTDKVTHYHYVLKFPMEVNTYFLRKAHADIFKIYPAYDKLCSEATITSLIKEQQLVDDE